MVPELRPPLPYSNWVWLLGAVLLVIAVSWTVTLVVMYRVRLVEKKAGVKTLGQLQRMRYNRHITEVQTEFAAGELTPREAHFALAALIRAAATEKTGTNVESQTPHEVSEHLGEWPVLVDALQWCEDETFPVQGATQQVATGVELARGVVNG